MKQLLISPKNGFAVFIIWLDEEMLNSLSKYADRYQVDILSDTFECPETHYSEADCALLGCITEGKNKECDGIGDFCTVPKCVKCLQDKKFKKGKYIRFYNTFQINDGEYADTTLDYIIQFMYIQSWSDWTELNTLNGRVFQIFRIGDPKYKNVKLMDTWEEDGSRSSSTFYFIGDKRVSIMNILDRGDIDIGDELLEIRPIDKTRYLQHVDGSYIVFDYEKMECFTKFNGRKYRYTISSSFDKEGRKTGSSYLRVEENIGVYDVEHVEEENVSGKVVSIYNTYTDGLLTTKEVTDKGIGVEKYSLYDDGSIREMNSNKAPPVKYWKGKEFVTGLYKEIDDYCTNKMELVKENIHFQEFFSAITGRKIAKANKDSGITKLRAEKKEINQRDLYPCRYVIKKGKRIGEKCGVKTGCKYCAAHKQYRNPIVDSVE